MSSAESDNNADSGDITAAQIDKIPKEHYLLVTTYNPAARPHLFDAILNFINTLNTGIYKVFSHYFAF